MLFKHFVVEMKIAPSEWGKLTIGRFLALFGDGDKKPALTWEQTLRYVKKYQLKIAKENQETQETQE